MKVHSNTSALPPTPRASSETLRLPAAFFVTSWYCFIHLTILLMEAIIISFLKG
jgi:hypothetical protein